MEGDTIMSSLEDKLTRALTVSARTCTKPRETAARLVGLDARSETPLTDEKEDNVAAMVSAWGVEGSTGILSAETERSQQWFHVNGAGKPAQGFFWI